MEKLSGLWSCFFVSVFLNVGMPLSAEHVDIISPFTIWDIPVNYGNAKNAGPAVQGYDIQFYENTFHARSAFQARKVIVWNYYLDPRLSLFTLPRENLI